MNAIPSLAVQEGFTVAPVASQPESVGALAILSVAGVAKPASLWMH